MLEALHHHDTPLSKTPGSPSHTRRASLKILSRNIDQVVLGNALFDTWYFSPYPESIIHGHDNPASKVLMNGDLQNGHTSKPIVPMISRLHVCPYCFKYTTAAQAYVAHLRVHLKEAEAESDQWLPVPSTALKVYEWEGYTVWDIDGEQEKLYCQNLSLFAKLFLEQKSVFFDTSGFHYFVLTHTPTASLASPKRGWRRRSSAATPDLGLATQVLGFFSKENLSWDANNLACILVFPPFQHRNLGQLLMAVSYKLSGWEWEDSVIGGPEKPLSVLGRRSYLRFWSERIARFFMGQTADADGHEVFAKRTERKTAAKEEMTVREIGERTGMLAEDVVAALSEMAIGTFLPRKRQKIEDDKNADATEEHAPSTMTVKRSHVLAWAEYNKVNLSGPAKEEGFLGEWALSDSEASAIPSTESNETDA